MYHDCGISVAVERLRLRFGLGLVVMARKWHADTFRIQRGKVYNIACHSIASTHIIFSQPKQCNTIFES